MLSQDHRNSFTSLLRSVASETSASEDQVVEFLLKSIQEVLSQDTGLDLHLEFIPESYSINVYSIRAVKDDPVGFGEITQDNALTLSKERLGFFTDDCFYHFLRQISLDLDTGFFSRVSVSQIAGRLGVHMDRLKRKREYDLFKERQGDLISGTVTRIETGGNIIVNLGLAEGFLSKFEILPNEFFSIGSTVQAYIYEVSLSADKYQIKLSRTRNEFLAHLMASFVPEIANNLITIKAISREPGSRSKVAVFSEDETVDPVGACIGRDGIRIKAVRGAIGNERIDIIPWDEDITVFISNALGIEISKFILHEDGSVEIVCTNDVLETLRIGRRQKVRLVARLCRRRLKITSVEEDERRLLVESAIMRSMLEKMGFSETAISLYSGSDLTSVHDILDADDDSLGRIIDATGANMSIEDFRLKAYNAYNEILAEEYIKHGIDPLLVYTPYLFGISPTVYKDKSIYTKEQISQLDSEEVCDLLKEYLSREKDLAAKEAEEIVLWSRGGSVE